MIDEFSSFARMPKPTFRRENLAEVARQSLFLHEVAHPAIRFSLDAPDIAPAMVCDRRQIGQEIAVSVPFDPTTAWATFNIIDFNGSRSTRDVHAGRVDTVRNLAYFVVPR